MAGSATGELVTLARLAAQGDAAAIEALLRLLYPRIRLYYRHWLFERPDSDEMAKDLTQDALMRLAENVHASRAETDIQLVDWVLTIARHVGVDHLRQRRMEWLHAQPAGDRDLERAQAPGGEEDRPTLGVLQDVVAQVYGAEPPHIQALFWHRLMERATWPEIAVLLATTPAGAKRMYQRAQRRMRNAVLGRVRAFPPREREEALARIDSDRRISSGVP